MRTPYQHGATTCKLKSKIIYLLSPTLSCLQVYIIQQLNISQSDTPLRWWFAGGLYMMKLAPGSLRLTALYGLIIAASVICFGASVGNWIDKTRRLTGNTMLALAF